MDLSVLRRSASRIAAAAVYELYPDVELLEIGETDVGFFSLFYFPHPVHTHVIEEKMRQIIQERRPIKSLEMVPISAKEYLKSLGLFKRAEAVEEDRLSELIQIGSFVDYCKAPHLKNTFELAAFQIEAKDLGGKEMLLEGICHNSKKDLKQFLKRLKSYISPEKMGEKLGFWKGDVWLSKGIDAKEKVIQILKKNFFPKVSEVSFPDDLSFDFLKRELGLKGFRRIFLRSFGETEFQVYFFGLEESIWKSYLQTIGKTLNMLGFDHFTISAGRRLDFVVKDGLEVNRCLVRTERQVSTDNFTIIAEVETILSQMMEKNLMMVELENQ